MSVGSHAAQIMRLIGECNGCTRNECEEWCWAFVRQEVEEILTSLVSEVAPRPPYRFPCNMRAAAETVVGQALKACEEAQETARAAVSEGADRIIEEAWDNIWASEGVLRKFPERDVRAGREAVLRKARGRGDLYGG